MAFLKIEGKSFWRRSLSVGLSSGSASLDPGYIYWLEYHSSAANFSVNLGQLRDTDVSHWRQC